MRRTFGMGPSRAPGLWLAMSSLCAWACSTNVEYLRAGRAGAGGSEVGSGGTGPSDDAGGGGMADDAADEPDTSQEDDRPISEAGNDASSEGDDAIAADGSAPRPVGITLGAVVSTEQLLPSDGGATYRDTCMGNQVVIGFNGTTDPPSTGSSYPKSIQVVCGELRISDNAPFTVTTSMTGALSSRGDGSTTFVSRSCPPDQVVMGFDARTGNYVDQLTFRCAPLSISAGPNGYVLAVDRGLSIDSIGGAGGVVVPPVSCPSGAIAVGSAVRAGQAIDAFGLLCAKPTLAFATSSP